MDPNSAPMEDFERWFYGGSPPAGDAADEPQAQADMVMDCRCTRTADALLGRLRATLSIPVLSV